MCNSQKRRTITDLKAPELEQALIKCGEVNHVIILAIKPFDNMGQWYNSTT